MENAIVSLVCIAMLVFGTATMAFSSLNSVDTLASHWKQAESQARAARLTDITYVSANTPEGGEHVEVLVKNDGDEALAYFEQWDVIVRYQDGTVKWIPYTSSTPGWTVGGIYLGGSPEVYEPNIVNPTETMKLTVNLDPAATRGAINLVTISTPNGVTTQGTFGWE